MNRFIFDVDGTITPSRQKMDPEFKGFFLEFARFNPVYLVTGSDKPKTVEQIGEDVFNACHTVYNCSGCDVWQSKKNIRKIEWQPEQEVIDFLEQELAKSKFYKKTGLHIEIRTGMLNFSIVGRRCSTEERFMYVEWDDHKKEREGIAKRFNKKFPELRANVAGETGIDIAPKNLNKAQILVDFSDEDTLYFFGDKMDKDGNDYPLAQKIENSFNVSIWEETYDRLQLMKVMGIVK